MSSLEPAIRKFFFSLLLTVLSSGHAFAGGYAIAAQTARATTLGNAVTAGIDDPSAVYINPAGLSQIEGNQVMGELNYINNLSSVTNSGRRSVNGHDDNFIPTLFGNYHIPATNLTAGIGLYSPFGLAVSYDSDSFTRFAAIQTRLRTFYLTPSIAWQPLPYLSVGGGVSFVHSSAVLSRALCFDVISLPGSKCTAPPPVEKNLEGNLRITDATNSYAYNLGVIVKPNDRLRVGLTYRSRVNLNFNTADVKFTDAGFTGGLKTLTQARGINVPLPPVISAGINWMITPAWSVEFVYDYTRWSEFQSLSARFDTALPALGGLASIPTFVIPENWKNTSTLRFGSSYNLDPNLQFRGGIILDETPIPSQTLSPAIPGADWLAITGGIGYTWRQFTVDLGYMAVFNKTRTVTNGVLEGNPALPFAGAPGPDKYQTFQNLVLVALHCRF